MDFVHFDVTLNIWLGLAALDLLTGLLAAFKEGNLNSSIAWGGAIKKAATLAVIAMTHLISPFVEDVPVGKFVTIYFCATEGLSIIENAGRAGVIAPAYLMPYLTKVRDNAK